MKKYMLLIVIASLLTGSGVTSHAAEQEAQLDIKEQTDVVEPNLDLEKEQEVETEQAELPQFAVKELLSSVGKSGQLKLKKNGEEIPKIEDYKLIVADETIIKVTRKGEWQALSEGKTTIELKPKLARLESERVDPLIVLTVEIGPTSLDSQEKKLDITPQFIIPEMTGLKVDDHGAITLKDIEGIKVTGTFRAFKNEAFSLDETGKWLAIAGGEASVLLDFTYSPEFMAELSEKIPNCTFVVRESTQYVNVRVFDGFYSLRPIVGISELKAKVGETGKFTIDDMYGATGLVAIFNMEDTTGLLEIDQAGNWKAVKAGESYLPLNVALTPESVNKIKVANPFKQEGSEPLILRTLKVTITEDKKDEPKKELPKSQEKPKPLPQTSEESSGSLLLSGMLLLISLGIYVKKNKTA